jgi:hypothetical protein
MTIDQSAHDQRFSGLIEFLKRVPGLRHSFGAGYDQDGLWWIKFGIDIEHPLAWSVVQELGHVLNYVSVNERLPTVFMPVSPPPYMNGGPRDFLSWVIESKSPDFSPDRAREWLEGRLPRPVEDPTRWPVNQEDLDDQA